MSGSHRGADRSISTHLTPTAPSGPVLMRTRTMWNVSVVSTNSPGWEATHIFCPTFNVHEDNVGEQAAGQ